MKYYQRTIKFKNVTIPDNSYPYLFNVFKFHVKNITSEKEMYNLMNILKKEEFSKNIRLVKARVPILKATCTITGINIDISMNRQNGCHAALVIRKILKKYNILKPSIIILKILLTKFNLNESHSGGMNSYLLFHLVYFLLVHKF